MLFPYCKDYLRILLLFTPASMLQTLFQNLTVTAGSPSFGLSLSVGAGIINIILDYLFMEVLGMGVMGAALGTGIGYVTPASIGILFFSSKNSALSFVKTSLRLSVLAKSCANGSSEMVSQISSAVTTFFFNRAMLKMLGENGVAAITIIIYAQFLLTTLYIGFSMGVAPVISFNYGAENFLRLKNIYRICLRFIAVSSACISLSSLLFGPRLVLLFAGSKTLVYCCARICTLFLQFSVLRHEYLFLCHIYCFIQWQDISPDLFFQNLWIDHAMPAHPSCAHRSKWRVAGGSHCRIAYLWRVSILSSFLQKKVFFRRIASPNIRPIFRLLPALACDCQNTVPVPA